MPGTDVTPTKLFCYQLDGLSFEVRLFTAPDGTVQAELTVLSGHGDFNAVYWADDDHSGKSAGLGGSLNMNGADGSTYDGQKVQWDSAAALSSPGLGREGTEKATFLSAGDTLTFELSGVTSIDDVDFLGFRATSTSTPGGSIKTISVPKDVPEDDPKDPPKDDPKDPPKDDPKDPPKDDPKDPPADDPKDPPKDDPKDPPADDPKDPPADDPEDPPEDPDLFPEWPQDISNVVFHFDTTGDGAANYSVKIDEFESGSGFGNDLDDYFEAMRAFIAENNPDIDPNTALIGVSVKGGTQPTQFFAVDADENGPEPDPDLAPDNLRNTGPGNDDVMFFEDFVAFFGSYEDRPTAAQETEEEDLPEEILL